MLLPKVIGYYRSARNAPKHHGVAVQPVPAKAARALVILFAVALVFLVKTLPIFSPENIFLVTQSRLQASADVLFTRLAAMRPGGALTAQDTALRAKFVNLESRLLYLQFGPDVMSTCTFCGSDDPRTYLYYALPALAAPHLFNLVVIAAVTSPLVGGRSAATWRSYASLAAAALAVADAYLVCTYDHQANARAARFGDLDCFFWTARASRNLALAGLDALLGWLLYLSSTNRAFAVPPSAADRVDRVARAVTATKSKLNAVGIIKNSATRDEGLRSRNTTYWGHESSLMQSVMEEREVVEAVNDALENRIDIRGITRDAETYAQGVVTPRGVPSASKSKGD